MADLINTGTSGYQTGEIDTATTVVDAPAANKTPVAARIPNGLAAGILQIEAILGVGPTLKGTAADLGARLSVTLNADGTRKLSGWTGLTALRGFLATSATAIEQRNICPIGVIAPYAGASVPVDWLFCDGTAVSRTTYSRLFSVISTTYGVGNGTTTFNLPDLRGRVVIMIDGTASRITASSTGGSNADTLGGTGGAQTHTLSTGEMPSHNHTGSATIAVSDTLGANTAIQTGANSSTAGGDTLINVPFTSPFTGGGGAHSNTQPWMALNYIIFAGA